MRRRRTRSYNSLLAKAEVEDGIFTTLSCDSSELPQSQREHVTHVSSENLAHLRDLMHLRQELVVLKSRIPIVQSLHFSSWTNSPYPRTDFTTIETINTGPNTLSLKGTDNRTFLDFETRVFRVLHSLNGLHRVPQSVTSHHRFHDRLITDTLALLTDLDLVKETEWNRQRSQSVVDPGAVVFQNDHYFRFSDGLGAWLHMTMHLCNLLVLMMHLFFGLTRRPVGVLVHGLRAILRMQQRDGPISDNIPIDLATLFKRYCLDPVTHSYVSCPRCFALYDHNSAPPRCAFQDFPESQPCNTPLFCVRIIRNTEHHVPLRTYLHQDMKEWVGRLLSRPEVDDLLDKPLPAQMSSFMEDIWHGSILSKTFKGSDGRRFGAPTPGSLSLVFGLAVDGFNSYRNIQAKKKSTSTGIYLVCFNLPPELRYLPENIYLVGVIPGKPSQDQINHNLSLLVKDLQPFWLPGVHYTRTGKYRDGRHVYAALIPLICDILAGRQVGGFGAHSHKLFCISCRLSLDDIEQLDPSLWPARTLAFHLEGVKAWKDAETAHEREMVFERYGARWSALLDLPYWNPIKFTIIDSMHNHYAGLLQNHLRYIWGINLEADDSEGFSDPNRKSPPLPGPALMKEATSSLALGDKVQLLKTGKSVLWHLCAERKLRRAKNKKMMVNELLNWRWTASPQFPARATGTVAENDTQVVEPTSSASEVPCIDTLSTLALDADHLLRTKCALSTLARKKKGVLEELCQHYGLPLSGIREDLAKRLLEKVAAPIAMATDTIDGQGVPSAQNVPANRKQKQKQRQKPLPQVIGRDVLSAIHSDMNSMQLPTWLQSAPKGFGTISHGKLSADEWRVASTVHIPFTLIRLWGHLDREQRKREMLDNYMQLIRAVNLAGSLRISEDHIKEYEEALLSYLRGMKTLYKEAPMKPNHHIAFHLAAFLRLFGPVHAWRAYAFERFNYLLQNLNTNKKPGQMEITFMTQVCRAANLRSVLRNDIIQDSMGDIISAYTNVINEDPRGTRIRDALSLEEFIGGTGVPSSPLHIDDLADDEFTSLLTRLNLERETQPYIDENARIRPEGSLFLHRARTHCSMIKIGGVTFKPKRHSLKDSNIVYSDWQNPQQLHVGRITSIFLHKRRSSRDAHIEETFLAIHRLVPLSNEDRSYDHFRRYGKDGGYLFYDKYHPFVDIISPGEVLCHFARTPINLPEIGEACVHVLPLDRLLRIPNNASL